MHGCVHIRDSPIRKCLQASRLFYDHNWFYQGEIKAKAWLVFYQVTSIRFSSLETSARDTSSFLRSIDFCLSCPRDWLKSLQVLKLRRSALSSSRVYERGNPWRVTCHRSRIIGAYLFRVSSIALRASRTRDYTLCRPRDSNNSSESISSSYECELSRSHLRHRRDRREKSSITIQRTCTTNNRVQKLYPLNTHCSRMNEGTRKAVLHFIANTANYGLN